MNITGCLVWLVPQLIEVMACLTQICKPPVPSRVLAYSRHIINISYVELKEPYQDLLVPISILSSSYHHLLVFISTLPTSSRILFTSFSFSGIFITFYRFLPSGLKYAQMSLILK